MFSWNQIYCSLSIFFPIQLLPRCTGHVQIHKRIICSFELHISTTLAIWDLWLGIWENNLHGLLLLVTLLTCFAYSDFHWSFLTVMSVRRWKAKHKGYTIDLVITFFFFHLITTFRLLSRHLTKVSELCKILLNYTLIIRTAKYLKLNKIKTVVWFLSFSTLRSNSNGIFVGSMTNRTTSYWWMTLTGVRT